jgi:Flp pilus assembly protein TadD
VDIERLQSNIEWAVNRGLGKRDLVPMLTQLVRHADAGTTLALDAQSQLAELLVEQSPWRAARLAQQVLLHRADHRLHAVQGLAFTILGHHRAAKAAYYQALAIAPRCPSYAHNLGHLLDVVFDRPRDALRWLAVAAVEAPDEPEIGASYAHALLRTGDRVRAREVLRARLGYAEDAADALLDRWLTAMQRR